MQDEGLHGQGSQRQREMDDELDDAQLLDGRIGKSLIIFVKR
jgi:hypothetical protein